MTCCLCESVALYKVGRQGYCKTHRQNAIDHRVTYCNTVLHPMQAARTFKPNGDAAGQLLAQNTKRCREAAAARATERAGRDPVRPMHGAPESSK